MEFITFKAHFLERYKGHYSMLLTNVTYRLLKRINVITKHAEYVDSISCYIYDREPPCG